MSKESTRIINQSLDVLSRLVESDTNVSIIDLNLLENLNTNQSLNYIKLEKELEQIEENSKKLVQLKQEFDENTELLSSMDKNITTLEGIVGELDTWLSEQEAAPKGKK